MDKRAMDKQNPEKSALEAGTREAYRDSLEGIDAATRSRLTQARHRALQELPKRRSRAVRWLPAGAVAAAALMAWVLVSTGPTGLSQPEQADIEILLAEDELEMFEDLEFYAWIDELDELEGGLLEDGVG